MGNFSLTKKMMAYFISTISIAFTIFFLITTYNSLKIINEETSEKLSITATQATDRINSFLLEQRVKTEIIADSVQASYDNLNQDNFKNILEKSISENDNTFGMGIWFEPSIYKNKEYFAPYGYRAEGTISYMDYSNDFKAYKDESWYILGKNKDRIAAWSDIYEDTSVNVTMITVTVPMYENNTFIGNITADVDLNSLSKTIESLNVGDNGHAFLLDANGTYLADSNIEKVTKGINISADTTAGLAENSSEILQKRTGNLSFDDNGIKSQLYYASVPETNWIIGIVLPQREVYKKLIGLIATLAITALVSILSIILLIIFISRKITKGIINVSKLSESMATGDLTYKINVKSNDEIGLMANNFNDMSDKINTIIKKVEGILKDVLHSANDLSSIAQDTQKETEIISNAIVNVAEGAASQDNILSDSVESANEMNNGVEQIANNMQEILAFAQETSDISNTNTKDIVKVIENMDEINKSTLESSSGIHKLSAMSNEIGNIISLITDIAEQTNLLALNAAIEAARAGEHGRGFAVVADEVKKLAEQSSGATLNVSKLIGDIQSEIENVVNSMDKGTSIVQEGTALVRNSEKAFVDINLAISKIFDQIHEISSVTEELYATSSNVSDGMISISDISKEAIANTEEVSSNTEELLASMNLVSESADKLTALSNDIKEAFSFFKTK
ncbi:methyl-accepting chemotaxis protein [Oceanirhabdus seepicola]|uniref:HAMP domain-containing protein n=1 Tax=Oceanirhabdus seepicola TaxID=2828781 RepID=A0A9J6P3T9_9CLOT|nr:methyl-accepting chemotaxis protein [Oceanirhabdus seepicola]MCM1991442.1 HAMP domain-containing protein [Oceanirhabdus seepicola]